MGGEVNKVVLAYSGGLDTSVILRWLKDAYRCEVVTFTADIGQGEEVAPAREGTRASTLRGPAARRGATTAGVRARAVLYTVC